MANKYERYENGVLVESVEFTEEELVEHKRKRTVEKRMELYGGAEEQIEYMVENGVDALIARNLKIKEDNPF